ncbi:MAG: ATP phosphoribosyltransferase [Chloroflexi bacterium]|nr:ATP phosphoribosyltransferase [Chloroflexota bacterium]MBT7081205.1 ATP phosphoribosyltransferase [Chloroflexota bacterium]MBT7290260.1 ATP phosphoribosyltransferase [Chloroflexota bacterium]
MKLKLALPKGWLQGSTSELLERIGFAFDEYHEKSRSYRPLSKKFPDLFIKVFHEKDIAIQVAMGNYDLGICGFDWVDELLSKYPSDAVLKLRNLGYGHGNIYVATSKLSNITLDDLKSGDDVVRIVTQYPNLAEAYALKQRFRRFKVLPVLGAAEVYPPENAELAILAETSEDELRERGMVLLDTIGMTDAFLIANRDSLEKKNLSALLTPLLDATLKEINLSVPSKKAVSTTWGPLEPGTVRLALPDGHQQKHTIGFLERAGIRMNGYQQGNPVCRPDIGIDGVVVKVVRPQDMPLQVANDNFDLAITGQDWLRDHLVQFPSSPVHQLLDMSYGKIRLLAVVHNDVPVNSLEELKEMMVSGKLTRIRVASEYINIADKYARDNHLAPYSIVPTWGASESFLPEDADLLIENAETGATLLKNNLKIIDQLMETTPCVIGNKNNVAKRDKIAQVMEILKKGL